MNVKRISLIVVAGVAAMMAAGSAQSAQMQSRTEPQAVAAPTEPVIAKPLEAPVFDSDTRNIQAIIDKDDDNTDNKPAAPVSKATKAAAPVAHQAAAALVSPSVAAPAPVAVAVEPSNEAAQPMLHENDQPTISLMTRIRIFAIRWHEVFDIVFLGVITGFAAMVYRNSQIQTAIMIASVRAAEDALRATQTSARFVQDYTNQMHYRDENQINLDLQLENA